MNPLLRLPRLTRHMSVIFIMLLLVSAGCKSKKKAMEAAQAQERARLEQQAALDRDKQRQDEEARRKEAEEKARRDREAQAMSKAPRERLDLYFNAIANSRDIPSANTNINEALSLFSSPQVPVLIVINESRGEKDYDKPMIIVDYLNYLKDQKKNLNDISDLQFDSAGRITEVELKKKK